jgi:hypothetical protein
MSYGNSILAEKSKCSPGSPRRTCLLPGTVQGSQEKGLHSVLFSLPHSAPSGDDGDTRSQGC